MNLELSYFKKQISHISQHYLIITVKFESTNKTGNYQ